MRGISLPIEMIVIIAVAVLVLVVIAAFFVGGAGGQIGRITDQDALTRGCVQLAMATRGCNTPLAEIRISNYDATCGTLSGNTLQVACCRSGYTQYDYNLQGSCQVLACRCSSIS